MKYLNNEMDITEKYIFSLLLTEYFYNTRTLTELAIRNASKEGTDNENVKKILPISVIKELDFL